MAQPAKHSKKVKDVQYKRKTPVPPCEMCRRKKEHYFCDICKTILSTKRGMEKHLLEKCNGWDANNQAFHKKVVQKIKPLIDKDHNYICSVCNKKFIRPSSLFNHMSIHEEDRPFECDECGKKFKKKGILKTHKRIHTGVKPYSCDVCDISFSHQTSLNNHKLVHSNVKPHICQFCFSSFRQVGNLNQHLEKFHGAEKCSLRNGFSHSPEPGQGNLKMKFIFSRTLKNGDKILIIP